MAGSGPAHPLRRSRASSLIRPIRDTPQTSSTISITCLKAHPLAQPHASCARPSATGFGAIIPIFTQLSAASKIRSENVHCVARSALSVCPGCRRRSFSPATKAHSFALFLLEAAAQTHTEIRYLPVDVCPSALAACHRRYSQIAEVKPICAEWKDALKQMPKNRGADEPLLLLFLGSSIGNLDRSELPAFLRMVRASLRHGDAFLLGADLIKDTDVMLAAYDDPTGVTAAFNLNVLGRINRELAGGFNLRCFSHEVRWNPGQRRIEMHLVSCRDQTAYIGALDTTFCFRAGETIWTESSHKFTPDELDCLARDSGFVPQITWLDPAWPFAEALWKPA